MNCWNKVRTIAFEMAGTSWGMEYSVFFPQESKVQESFFKVGYVEQ